MKDIEANIDRMVKELGLTCKACKKPITGENCNDHWFFLCNPDYVPDPIIFPFELKSPEAK